MREFITDRHALQELIVEILQTDTRYQKWYQMISQICKKKIKITVNVIYVA